MNNNKRNQVQAQPYEAPLTSEIEISQGNNFLASDFSATAENFVVDTEESGQWF